MSTIHEQAMNYVYQQVLHRLLSFFSRAERAALQLLIQRLLVAAGGIEHIGTFKVLVSHSGSLDSSYTLALLRAAQLSIASRAPATFQLRVATLRLSGISAAAMGNIHRSYSALFVYDDPRVETLMVDNREVLPFNYLAPLSDAGIELNRLNMLMISHSRVSETALEVGDDCYLAVGEFYGQMARWRGGVDIFVSGDTPRQQKQFLDRLAQAAQKAGLPLASTSPSSLDGLFAMLDQFAGDCWRELYAEHGRVLWRPVAHLQAHRRPGYTGIHDLVMGDMADRGPLFSEFLGFEHDELTVHLSENEYLSPLLPAHLQGLQACFVEDNTYETGFAEYVQRVLVMMRRKKLSERLCRKTLKVYANRNGIARQRALADAVAQQTLGLNESHLVCLLFAPFADGGAGLENFLRRCHPGMLVALHDLHKALGARPVPETISQWLVEVSGLPLSLLRKLYRRPAAVGAGGT